MLRCCTVNNVVFTEAAAVCGQDSLNARVFTHVTNMCWNLLLVKRRVFNHSHPAVVIYTQEISEVERACV